MADHHRPDPGRSRHNVQYQDANSLRDQAFINSVLAEALEAQSRPDRAEAELLAFQKMQMAGLPLSAVNMGSVSLTTNLTNKKKSSFQITSITTVKHSEHHEADADSMDDLDETHTEDVSSEVLDWSKTTDIEPDPSSTEETIGNLALVDATGIKEKTDTSSRFKVVKIATKEPFKRGRWICFDFSDAGSDRSVTDFKGDEFPVPVSENSSAASSVHYVPDQSNEYEDAAAKDTSGQFTVKSSHIPMETDNSSNAMLVDDDSDYDYPSKQPATMVKKVHPSDSNQQKTLGKNPNIIPASNVPNSVSVKEFTNAPPVLQNIPKPKQTLVGNNIAPDASSSNPDSNSQPSAQAQKPGLNNANQKPMMNATKTVVVNTAGNPSKDISRDYSNSAMLAGAGVKVDTSKGSVQNSQMVAPGGVMPGQVQPNQGNGKLANGNMAPTNTDYHQSSQLDASNKDAVQNSQSVANSISSQQKNNVSEFQVTVTAPNMVPQIQVTAQSAFDRESAAGGPSDARKLSTDNNAATQTTKEDNQIESTEKTQSLLEQMVGMPAALGSPIKDGEGDERQRHDRRSPLHLMEFGSSTVAIDNKIEQAMDLVKSHLMFAVREEVEVLREQIKELLEQKAQLEYENSVLKLEASSETLAKLTNGPPSQPPTTSAS